MRNLRELDLYRDAGPRVLELYGTVGDETCGVFNLPSCIDAATLHIVASCGEGWEHVSVSRKNRCPNWFEMEQVKRAFYADDETAVQFHVPSRDHINLHPYCLHLWRPTASALPRPPGWMIG
jgi:hypothetical protein